MVVFKKKSKMVLSVLIFVLIFSALTTVFASEEDISIERSLAIEIEELEHLDEAELNALSGIACPKCDRGIIDISYETWRDRERVSSGHWGSSCTISTSHYMNWYYDVKVIECDSCSYSIVTVMSGDYGWYCTK